MSEFHLHFVLLHAAPPATLATPFLHRPLDPHQNFPLRPFREILLMVRK